MKTAILTVLFMNCEIKTAVVNKETRLNQEFSYCHSSLRLFICDKPSKMAQPLTTQHILVIYLGNEVWKRFAQ